VDCCNTLQRSRYLGCYDFVLASCSKVYVVEVGKCSLHQQYHLNKKIVSLGKDRRKSNTWNVIGTVSDR
jgi:hypothetical protein